MIQFVQVSKIYSGSFQALQGVSFSIMAGELVFFIGHSGAGKSTLLKLIAAIEQPTSGTVKVGKLDSSTMKRSAVPYLRRGLGLIFQEQKILYDRPVLDNVLLPLQVVGMESKVATARARAALDKVGLLHRGKANPVSLSGGEKQRMCIARAVVNRPTVLIADEPTANLDAAYAQEIMGVFRSFHQVGVTVLIATHDLALIENKSRVLQLYQGKLAQ
ncbi:MAG: putative ABC-type transport system ATPase component/cell division protein [Pseudomonadota bacterium]|jgi:cell division transport system ATP-binding protein